MERFSRQSGQASTPKPAEQTATQAPVAAATANRSSSAATEMPTLASKLLILAVIIASIAVIGTILASTINSFSSSSIVDDDKYQAVFLDNGQVYFGRLDSSTSKGYMQLTDIFYLQVQQQIQPGQGAEASPEQQISLAKLGKELHGPEDKMFISPNKVVFWENLKDEGQVVTAIKDYYANGGESPAADDATPAPAPAPAAAPTPTPEPTTPAPAADATDDTN